jgi:transposase
MMLGRTLATRVWVAVAPIDMRKGFHGLVAAVESSGLDLYSGHPFVFLGRRRDRVKILTWERGGLAMYLGGDTLTLSAAVRVLLWS